MRMRYIVICGLSGCAVFYHISHKPQDFRKKKKLLNKNVFWFSLQLLFETFIILRKLIEI